MAWTFSGRLTDNEKHPEHRAQRNPDFELQRKEAEVSLRRTARLAFDLQFRWFLRVASIRVSRLWTIESVLDSRVTCGSTFERCIV